MVQNAVQGPRERTRTPDGVVTVSVPPAVACVTRYSLPVLLSYTTWVQDQEGIRKERVK